MNRRWRLGALGCVGLLVFAACSSRALTHPDGGRSGGASGSGSSGSGGPAGATAGAGGAAGATPVAGAGGTGATAGEGVTGAGGGAAGEADGGAAGSDAGSGADGSISHGSPGCGRAPAPGDKLGVVVAHTVGIASLANVYLAGGTFAQASGTFDLSHRPYGLRLPADYDPNRSSPVIVETTPCGIDAATWAGAPQQGITAGTPPKEAIIIVLVPVKGCLLPGGPAIGDRTDSPDVPYFRAALADAESSACLDESRVTVAGFSSNGAHEAEMLACAAGDVVRAVTTYGGGLLVHRPPCKGQVAAMLVAPTNDSQNPIGPVAATDPSVTSTDNLGTLPLRDDILQRNGCTGTTTEPWIPMFPACVRFVGCPVATPVVWCPIMSSLQAPGFSGGQRYAPDAWWVFEGMVGGGG